MLRLEEQDHLAAMQRYAEVRRRIANPRPKVVPARPVFTPPARISQGQIEDYLAKTAEVLPNRYMPIQRIKQLVAQAHGLSQADIEGPGRAAPLALARLEFYWLARRHTPLSTTQIGRFCGGRDHSSVHTGIKRFDARLGAGKVAPRVKL